MKPIANEQKGNTMLSISEIAIKAKVSKATVSRALCSNTKDIVKPETRKRILEICKTHNYLPMSSARALASGKTQTIGLVLSDIEKDFASPYLSEIISSLVFSLKGFNYGLKLIMISPQENPLKSDEEVLATLHSRSVDGFVLGSGILGDQTLEELKRLEIPALTLYSPSDNPPKEMIHRVGINNAPATLELVQHLRFCGHENVAYIKRRKIERSFRSELFAATARKEGLKSDEIEVSLTKNPIQTISATRSSISMNWEHLKKYSAWVFENDLMALGALDIMREKGVTIGRDIAIAGYDNIEENANYYCERPILTTIAPPRKQLGELTGQLLMELIETPKKVYESRFLLSRLIVRETT